MNTIAVSLKARLVGMIALGGVVRVTDLVPEPHRHNGQRGIAHIVETNEGLVVDTLDRS